VHSGPLALEEIELVRRSGEMMETAAILSNALNAAKINAYLLRRTARESLDADAINGLDSSLHDAEKLVGDFQRRIHAEISQQQNSTV
jgi:hypothetical protein